MNERIKQFAEQARKYAEQQWLEAGFPNRETYHTTMAEDYNKKFAELIVEECINEIHVADVGDLKGKSYYLDKVAEHIEKHFGVEE